jgi:hypothetical protein
MLESRASATKGVAIRRLVQRNRFGGADRSPAVSTIDEKRVYGERRGAQTAYVASRIGLAAVSISGEAVGEFGLIHRGEVQDVAADAGTLVVATGEDVYVADGGDGEDRAADGEGVADLTDDGFGTDFGVATAVGVDVDGQPLAAGRDGRLSRYVDGWQPIGTVPAAVRAFGRDTVACADGLRSLADLDRPTLQNVRDVDDPGPVVATDDGVYRRETTVDDRRAADETAWHRERKGATDRVAVAGDRLAAVADGTLLLNAGGNWERPETVGEVRDVAAGERCYAVTEDGRVLVEGEAEWRSRSIGLRDVRRIEVA